MTYMKTNQDELLEGFCRGCLNKYDDPADLLHYTEKNRRLFIYSTGIQVKCNDTFTFQICKDCYINMKVSCKFKKQCRSSERRFKSFLRLKEVGEAPDLLTFLRSSDNNIKFPILSGNSTPVNQKREDDNESTCTSIRNFMTDILQGEEMPDTEARIIKEVIEEEADLLEDSLDSHWLQDEDSVDSDYRLDFSFSPYVTPRSTNNDHCYTPIKQIEPSLRCKNNHAKNVLLQLPTSRYINDDPIKLVEPNKSILENNNFNQKGQAHISDLVEKAITDKSSIQFAAEDSIAELIEQNEDFLIRDETEVEVKSIALNALEIKSVVEKHIQPTIEDVTAKNLELDTSERESPADRIQFPLTESDIAVKSLKVHSFDISEDNRLPVSDSNAAGKINELTAFDVESRLSKDKYNLIETDRAVKSISLSGFGLNSECEYDRGKLAMPENYAAVKRINLSNDIVKQIKENVEDQLPISENDIAVKSIHVDNEEEEFRSTENDAAVKHILISNMEDGYDVNQFSLKADEIEDKGISNSAIKIEDDKIFHITETDIAVKSIGFNSNEVDIESKSDLVNEVLQEITELDGNHEQDISLNSIQMEDQNECESDQYAIDTIDKNLEEALKNQSNKDFSLDDLLVSPTEVHTPVARLDTPTKEIATGISTPTINNILFGEKLDEDNDCSDDIELKRVDNGIDVLEEFFKEGVKDFEPRSLMPASELPLELKYDLQNAHCLMCNKKFSTMRALKIHLNKKHQITFPRKKMGRIKRECKHCGKVVDDMRNLARHVRIHNKNLNEEFKCEHCHLTFLSEYKFKVHLKVHDITRIDEQESSNKRYICNICGSRFKWSSNFATHMKRHTSNYTLTCEVCNKGFFRVSDYEMHFMRRHTTERPYKCVHCDKGFVAKYCLAKHMLKHADREAFICHYCGKKFALKSQIITHIHKSQRCIRTRGRPKRSRKIYRCPYCPLSFGQKYTLVKHQNLSSCWEVIRTKFDEPLKTFSKEKPKDLPMLIEQ